MENNLATLHYFAKKPIIVGEPDALYSNMFPTCNNSLLVIWVQYCSFMLINYWTSEFSISGTLSAAQNSLNGMFGPLVRVDADRSRDWLATGKDSVRMPPLL